MPIKERLKDFAGSIAVATTDPPDNYAEWSSWTYETHMADLKKLWAEIRAKLKRDLERAKFIDGKGLSNIYCSTVDSGLGRGVVMPVLSRVLRRCRNAPLHPCMPVPGMPVAS